MRAVRALCLGLLVCLASAQLQEQQQLQEVPASVTLQNSRGFRVVLTPIGAAIQSMFVPDCSTGKAVDVVLG
jgi:hypothetical protein